MESFNKLWLNKNGELTIPYGVEKIEDNAFANNLSITKVTIPNSVVEIGAKAFHACKNLKNIKIGNNVSVIGENAFSNCNSLKNINIPQSINIIEEAAFAECENLENVTIHQNANLNELSDCIFYKCGKLKKTSFPRSLEQINQFAFAYCDSLKEVDLSNNENLESIEKGAFFECEKLEKINIPNKIEQISDSTFANCTSLKEVNFGKNSHLSVIEKNAFQNCSSLTEITIPDTVEVIEEMAFFDCNNLQTISLPDYLAVVPNIAFANCTSLHKINFNHNLESIENSAFYNCINLPKIQLPNSLEKIEANAFANCINLAEISGGKHIKEIEPSAFYNCNSLTKFEFPDKVKNAENVFNSCSNLKEVTLGKYTEKVSPAFSMEAPNLHKVTLNNNIKHIPECAFYNSKNLTELNIQGLTRIPYNTFKNNHSVKSITIDNHNFKLKENEKLISLQRCNEKVAIVFSDNENKTKTRLIDLDKKVEKTLNLNTYLTNNGGIVRAIDNTSELSLNSLKLLQSNGEKQIYISGSIRNSQPNENDKNIEYDLYSINNLIQIKSKIIEMKNHITVPTQYDPNKEKKLYGQIVSELSNNLEYDFYSTSNIKEISNKKKLYEKYTGKNWDNYYEKNKDTDPEKAQKNSNSLNSLLTGASLDSGSSEVIRNITAEFGIKSNTVVSDKYSWNQVQLDSVWYNDYFTNYQIPLSKGKLNSCRYFLCGQAKTDANQLIFDNNSHIYTHTHTVGRSLAQEDKQSYLINNKTKNIAKNINNKNINENKKLDKNIFER